ncbi:MAG TPA: biopolymer transporter ExbD [Candidatus Eremiobacteraceae bacterium]|nr:biopolymer transporter ExbD [Candidatus Eremiobacteraceae bacterium]
MSMVGSNPEEDVMSTINITPFTDVLLVLLIIFMILTSLLKPPPVPEAINKLKVTNSPITVIIGHEQAGDKCPSSGGKECDTIQVGAETVWTTGDDEKKIYDRFKTYFDQFNQTQTDIIIKAAPTVHYGTVLRVMDAAKTAGFNQFGLANKVHGAADNAVQNNP